MMIVIQGFTLCLTLIFAIGAQNAFVLRQGILKSYVLPIVLFCAMSDTILITLGVIGFDWIVGKVEGVAFWFQYIGVIFLVFYGLARFWTLFKEKNDVTEGENVQTLNSALLTLAAFTYLNPHVYLDTVVLMGSYSLGFSGVEKVEFALGASLASFTFFFALGYGARLLTPIFRDRRAWVILDILMGLLMLLLAWKLALTKIAGV